MLRQRLRRTAGVDGRGAFTKTAIRQVTRRSNFRWQNREATRRAVNRHDAKLPFRSRRASLVTATKETAHQAEAGGLPNDTIQGKLNTNGGRSENLFRTEEATNLGGGGFGAVRSVTNITHHLGAEIATDRPLRGDLRVRRA